MSSSPVVRLTSSGKDVVFDRIDFQFNGLADLDLCGGRFRNVKDDAEAANTIEHKERLAHGPG